MEGISRVDDSRLIILLSGKNTASRLPAARVMWPLSAISSRRSRQRRQISRDSSCRDAGVSSCRMLKRLPEPMLSHSSSWHRCGRHAVLLAMPTPPRRCTGWFPPYPPTWRPHRSRGWTCPPPIHPPAARPPPAPVRRPAPGPVLRCRCVCGGRRR